MPANPDTATSRSVLVVLGMHRGGTSATAGALRCLGVPLGRRLYRGHAEVNAKGYFEHADMADLHDEALLALGSAWDDILLPADGWWQAEALRPYARRLRELMRRDFGREPLWAVKDPRLCRLLPWWLTLLREEGLTACCLLVLRSPEAVFRSLHRRDGFSREKAYWLWCLHYLEAERWSRDQARAIIDYDDFLEAPGACLAAAGARLGVTFPVAPERAADCLAAFLSRDLRHHHRHTVPDAAGPIVELAWTIYARLREQAAPAHAATELQSARQRMLQMQQAAGALWLEHLAALGMAHGGLALTLRRLVRSWSWHTGKPVRFLERLLGRDV
jgi:hypothetical protein